MSDLQHPIPKPQSPSSNPQAPSPKPQAPIHNPQAPSSKPQSTIHNPQSTISQSKIPNPKSKITNALYLIPVLGFFPSLWTLYRHQGTREQLALSRLSITLAFSWLLGYFLLTTAIESSDFLTLRLLILNSFLTSGYFLVSIWLILRIAKGRSYRLSGFSEFAERWLGKY